MTHRKILVKLNSADNAKMLYAVPLVEFSVVLILHCRGVGCIFTEMVSGTATFPGTKDAWDQLDRIWQVKLQLSVMFHVIQL
jgi:hypothetical protein